MGIKKVLERYQRGMANPPKPNGRIAHEHLDNALSKMRIGIMTAKEYHQHSQDARVCHEYLEIIGIFEEAIIELKLSKSPNGGDEI
jgi:hypothetical protein